MRRPACITAWFFPCLASPVGIGLWPPHPFIVDLHGSSPWSFQALSLCHWCLLFWGFQLLEELTTGSSGSSTCGQPLGTTQPLIIQVNTINPLFAISCMSVCSHVYNCSFPLENLDYRCRTKGLLYISPSKLYSRKGILYLHCFSPYPHIQNIISLLPQLTKFSQL